MQAMNQLIVLAAPDSFSRTASAGQVAAAIAKATEQLPGVACDQCPLSDGGDGFLQVVAAIGGSLQNVVVRGPLGVRVEAPFRLAGDVAYVESATACGLGLVGGPAGNDPVRAGTYGVGELVAAALAAGATKVVLGVGGTASTDGGRGAIEALEAAGWLDPLVQQRIAVVVATDVATVFGDAAATFGPQKGATGLQVELLRRRLAEDADELCRRFGRDVRSVAGSGAGGGLAGGLAAVGARIESGAAVVADIVGFDRRLARAAVVVTGEGRTDVTSRSGKVVGEVLRRAAQSAKPAVVVAGSITADVTSELVRCVDLTSRYGRQRAWDDPTGCVTDSLGEVLGALVSELRGAR